MRKVCEVYLVSNSASDERGVELTFPGGQYKMMDAFEQIHTKSPGDVYWQVDEFYCFDYLAPHLDESMSIFEFNSLTDGFLSWMNGRKQRWKDSCRCRSTSICRRTAAPSQHKS